MPDLLQTQPLEVTLGCATPKQVALELPYCFHDWETPCSWLIPILEISQVLHFRSVWFYG